MDEQWKNKVEYEVPKCDGEGYKHFINTKQKPQTLQFIF